MLSTGDRHARNLIRDHLDCLHPQGGNYGRDSILQLSVPETRRAENRLLVMPVPAVMKPYRPLPSSRTSNRSPPGTSQDPPGPNSISSSQLPACVVMGPAGPGVGVVGVAGVGVDGPVGVVGESSPQAAAERISAPVNMASNVRGLVIASCSPVPVGGVNPPGRFPMSCAEVYGGLYH